jgi:uncharacterized protein Yka (UPF0111/DUF47 family)
MIVSWIKKYILPKEIDFLSALNNHAMIIKKIVDDLEACFSHAKEEHCRAIIEDQHQASKIRDENMRELLNSFITPIDRESIYRVITQLDWIAISVRHFVIEAKAYEVKKLDEEYTIMIEHLKLQAELLTAGFKTLRKDDKKTAQSAKRVRDAYDDLMDVYIAKMAKLSSSKNREEIFIHQALLGQIKEISKRMRMTANSLEDIIMKMS